APSRRSRTSWPGSAPRRTRRRSRPPTTATASSRPSPRRRRPTAATHDRPHPRRRAVRRLRRGPAQPQRPRLDRREVCGDGRRGGVHSSAPRPPRGCPHGRGATPDRLARRVRPHPAALRRHHRRGPRAAQRRRPDPRLNPEFGGTGETGRMAHTRFLPDRGLTFRMTLVMFLLGGLFVTLVVSLMAIFWEQGGVGIAVLIGLGGLGVAWYQWYSSDKLAMRAMRAREVSPEEAPELHGMIDRLCALADMPKPRVGIADTP